MSEHIAVLANPSSGKGRGGRAAEAAVGLLRERGVEVRTFVGGSAADTARLAAVALTDDPRVLMVVGGDGTLSGVLETVCGATVPIALVAAGTGNDLARALGLPRGDARAAAELALTGVPRGIDVGVIRTAEGSRRFLTIAALGFDAKVSDRTNRLRWPHGAPRYYLALLIELMRLQPMDFTLAVDEEPARSSPGTLIAAGSTSSYGGGMPICAGAVPDDGLLDLVHVAPLRRLRLLRLFPLLLRGRHLSRGEVAHRRARSVTVSAPGLVVYADGERIGEGECTISVLPRALTMMVPKESDD
ncbi:YegS/Rv2252/BmrU family lipid kinase [Microbacterium paraoxydans]|uniref:YegS/Rv2252/BmrU family lipid kinase n=1 Tax=Microbacterium paraoxydans TaxID=199592 RepID=UPI001CFB457F|nr:YegS/Rv2252/BmrU family lipid kinase [Microbacterium paraoxydans]